MQSRGLRDWIGGYEACPNRSQSQPDGAGEAPHQYTARNTFDYFIHKDLGGFLRRELDFYIKNEVMHLDDIDDTTRAPSRAVPQQDQGHPQDRPQGHPFLEQLENFQKKLWLKKKFVVETNYCITLDRVPEELYPEIAANDAQREEWVRLFAINEIEKDLTGPGYSFGCWSQFGTTGWQYHDQH